MSTAYGYVIIALALALMGYGASWTAFAKEAEPREALEIIVFNREGDTLRTATVTAEDLVLKIPVGLAYDSARAIHYAISNHYPILMVTVSAPGYETERRKLGTGQGNRIAFTLGRPGDRYFYSSWGRSPYTPDTEMVGFKMRDSIPRPAWHDYPPAEREGAMIREQQWRRDFRKERIEEIAGEIDVSPDDIKLVGSEYGMIAIPPGEDRHDVLDELRRIPFIELAGPLLSRQPGWVLGNEPYLSIMPQVVAVEFLNIGDMEMRRRTIDSIESETGLKLVRSLGEYHQYYFAADPSVAEELNAMIAAINDKYVVAWAYVAMPVMTFMAGR